MGHLGRRLAGPNRKVVAWLMVWLLTRAFLVARVGFWNDADGVDLEDVNAYQVWSDQIAANHAFPSEETWQYPPGAAFLLLVPRIGGDYGIGFVAAMLVFDLIGLALIALLARREGRETGVWIWLLAMPLVFSTLILRFDIVPTVFAVAALVVIHRRPALFGALAGLGATVKVWPIFVLFAEWDKTRLLRSAGAALAAVVAMFALAWTLFGDPLGFVTNQGDRGLHNEAIGALPWQLREAITGQELPRIERFGTVEVGSSLGDAIGKLLTLASLAVLLFGAVLWLLRHRAIEGGRVALGDAVLSRDLVFTIVLVSLVVSRVLSVQFMIWVVGLAAVVLSSSRTSLSRPAWAVIAAALLTAGVQSEEGMAYLAMRNVILLFAAADAVLAMLAVLVNRPALARWGFGVPAKT